jgi:L-asparaginase
MTSTYLPKVHIIGTGGSIAGVGHDQLDMTEYGDTGKKLNIANLLYQIPKINTLAQITFEDFSNVTSNSLTTKDWIGLANHINEMFKYDPKLSGIAITHGSMTIEETAYFLNLTIKSSRPVVLTGSLRPSTAISSDAHLNIHDCILVASAEESRDKGVLVVLNGEINSARDVSKTNTYRLETFKSQDLGFLGYADADHSIVYYRSPTRQHTYQTEFNLSLQTELPKVDIVYSYVGAEGDLINYLVNQGSKGIIICGIGSGNPTPSQSKALVEAQKAGVAVVHSSRLGAGRVLVTTRRREAGIIAADTLTPQKARILLMLGLSITKNIAKLQEMFYKY